MPVRVWVNFKELRARLKFEDVLRYFKVEVKRKGSQHQGFCPLPSHEGTGNSPSFSANLDRGIFHCFGCGAKGNVLEFAALMKGVNPADGDALRSIAVELQQTFVPEGASTRTKPHAERSMAELKPMPVVTNAPLDFELKGLDAGHPYLVGRGFTIETIAYFGVGFCSRGSLKDRIAIPLHDGQGRLIGYAGRVVDDALVAEDNPRYRLPSRRERNGTVYDFRKTLFLYNGHRIKAPCDDLVIVEGCPSVWWLNQHGIPSTVALMGSECSDQQIELLVNLLKPSGRLWILPDGDAAGAKLGQMVASRIARRRFVRWIPLADGQQPTDLSTDELKGSFEW